ncbi:hypothetical protein IEI94_13950 [Halomonas sp. ML-15]|uniref:hypothetical protein n=1 Tax=Halomonas sp. ML-15 TaxID=2773305 RepID=UPI001747AD96|nr:hypothetical protein [Halomonas sp. ML-15]MBD3896955.1 hypothetical protein [Halomonas sp. ML-15]
MDYIGIAQKLKAALAHYVMTPWFLHTRRATGNDGYPPDLQDAAVQTVLQQAEALTGLWQSA